MDGIFYSIQEAAELLKVDYKVVYRLVKEGRIPSQRVGWQFRLSQDDLNAYLKAERLKQHVIAETLRGGVVAGDGGGGLVGGVNRSGGGAGGRGITRMRARQMEVNFINWFSERVAEVDVLRHPTTGELIHTEDWKQVEEVVEDREALMQVLQTAYLDRRTLATTPRNTVVRYRLAGKTPLVIEARFVAHLDTLCHAEEDERPASLEDLLVEIDAYEMQHRTTRAVYVVGLASPTGWEEGACLYIGGGDVGDRYHNWGVRFVLIDLGGGGVWYNQEDPVTSGFAGLFKMSVHDDCGDARRDARGDARRDARVHDLVEPLRVTMQGRTGLMLSEHAHTLGVAEELLVAAARVLENEGPFRVIPDRGQGWIFVRV